MIRKKSLLLALCFLAIVAAGCKHTSPPTVVPGWVEAKSAGVGISLPPDFEVMDLSSGNVDKIVASAEKRYPNQPDMTKMVKQIAASGAMKLVALAPDPGPGKFRENLNLIVLPLPTGKSLEDVMDLNRKQFETMANPGTIKVEKRQFPIGDVCYFQADTPSAQGSHSSTGYIVLHDGQQFVFTFSSAVSDKDSFALVADKAMKTAHFNP